MNGRYLWWGLLTLAGLTAAAVVQADNLYSAATYRALASDNRAYRVGDNITVLVYENSSSSTSASTNADKSSGISVTAKGKHSTTNLGLDVGDEYEGKGKIQRSGKVLAQLTVTVKSVDEAGLLFVSGDQIINVNDEKQEIRVEGKLRPRDIGDNNTVLSTRLSDARISYIGDGVLADRQRPGWITRILHWLGLF
jgi:flagellar L-ring protein FlgH